MIEKATRKGATARLGGIRRKRRRRLAGARRVMQIAVVGHYLELSDLGHVMELAPLATDDFQIERPHAVYQ